MDSEYMKIYADIIDRNNRELEYKTLIDSHNNLYREKSNLEVLNKKLRIQLLKYEETYDTELNAELLLRDNYF